MIITPHPYGRLANRLFLASHWIAHAEATGDSYLHLGFVQYARFFSSTCRSPFLYYRSTRFTQQPSQRLVGIVNVWNKLEKTGVALNLLDPTFLEKQSAARFLFTIGWGFRGEENFKKYHPIIHSFFQPTPRHQTNIGRCLERARAGVDHLVGVHMRQTDYRKFNGGQWFYDATTYRTFMEKMAALLGGRVRFLVCTDGLLDKQDFKDIDIAQGTGLPVEDCYELAGCDFIIGPPSTFSAWAAYYGQVPLCFLRTPSQELLLEDFATR